MVHKGTKPPRLVSLVDELSEIAKDGSHGDRADAVQLKIQRAEMLSIKLLDHWFLVTDNIRTKKMNIDYLKWLLKNCPWGRESSWERWKISYLQQLMYEKYYQRHGRPTEKHQLIRQQEDQIRVLQRNIVHRGNSLAAEKKLIKDLKIEEKTRAKIIANGLEYVHQWHSKEFSSKEDIEDEIAVHKSEIADRISKRNPIHDEEIDRSGKSVRILLETELSKLEKELKKINEMKVEIHTLILSLEIQLQQKTKS